MKTPFSVFLVLWMCLGLTIAYSQGNVVLEGKVVNERGAPIEDVLIRYQENKSPISSDEKGKFTLTLPSGTYTLLFRSIKTTPYAETINLNTDVARTFRLQEVIRDLDELVVEEDAESSGIRQLRSIEAGGLYEGKKTEVIDVQKLVSNKAANNARQAFAKVPSLNIWESDHAGLQLDIGGRGLSPKRTSNFNTRQNGYDISADALGYPESYYSPPLQAVQQIEVVRGAGALQYGSQFGGLVNFKMKKGTKDKPFHLESRNTYGAFQFFNTFNSFHGQTKKLNYYAYLQYKRGDGWRANSAFEQYGAYLSVDYQLTSKLKINGEFTHMYYLSQQAGGLTDEMFAEDPKQSNRQRNWFRVNWNLPALTLEYALSDRSKIYSRTFGLLASRTSLGLLETPDIEDPLTNRDLIDGDFRNLGNETRFVYSYPSVGNLNNSVLIGSRLYSGFTNFSQGFGSPGDDALFSPVDTAFLDRRKSDFEFPNTNLALFAESILRVSPRLSFIPGIRYEYIDTESSGWFTTTVRTNSFGDFVEQVTRDTTDNQRQVFLYGLGVSYKPTKSYELYANATANYRAINFTDVQIQTNTQLVDTLIRDESGYSFDVGIRRMDFSPFYIEGGFFFLVYDDRIGEVIDDGLRVRTNIGSARIFGVELLLQLNLLELMKSNSKHALSYFVNGSINRGEYTQINARALAGVRTGNRLEDLPTINVKTGFTYRYEGIGASIQLTHISKQYSDAANTADAFKGVFGPIPSYTVVDLSASYRISKLFQIEGSLNNLLNEAYFTRRATAYPGPGIIPALRRTWSFSLNFLLE